MMIAAKLYNAVNYVVRCTTLGRWPPVSTYVFSRVRTVLQLVLPR